MPKYDRNTILKEIKRLDPGIDHPEDMHSAIFLLGSAIAGPNADKIQRVTKLPRLRCRQYSRTARENKIFVGSKIAAEWYKKDGGIAFWLDCMTLDGLMKRV
jgi:hypothetical protein